MVAAVAAAAALACRPEPGLGSVAYTRGALRHVVDLATCSNRITGTVSHGRSLPFRSPDGRLVATIRSTGAGKTARQTIWVNNRPVFSETQYYKTIGPGDTPGPIMLLGWSGDGRWIFFTIDPGGSGSIAADGLILRVVSTDGGTVHKLGPSLVYSDYLAWCGGRLVWTGGRDRVATNGKRLLVASPPSWRPKPLVAASGRAWGSVACAPDGKSVVVQSQAESNDAHFFHTRWALWRVGLDGSQRELTSPPAHYADESPRFEGGTLLFVRMRSGDGMLFALRGGRIVGPFASLGYSLGYYGHHDWPYTVRR